MTDKEQSSYDTLTRERDSLKGQSLELANKLTALTQSLLLKTAECERLLTRNRELKVAQPDVVARLQAAKDLKEGHPVAVQAADAPDTAEAAHA